MKLSLGYPSLMSNNESTNESIMEVRDKHTAFGDLVQYILHNAQFPFVELTNLVIQHPHYLSSLF